MHPQNIPCLSAAQIDCCILANNHVLDWGAKNNVQSHTISKTKGQRLMQKNEKCAAMLREIEEEYQLTSQLTGKFSLAPRVKAAMKQVPRHEFVPFGMQTCAYVNSPLPIGYGQTISQPYIIALMTDLLCTSENHVVLEIGTGCGYQAAVLARLVKKICSIEIVPPLARQAKERLHRLGYHNVEVREGDGYYGWNEFAPYDGIILTAATPEIPMQLIDQLKAGGKMVLPIGYPYARQNLIVVSKEENGTITQHDVLAVAFVPLTGDHDHDRGKTTK